MALTIVATRHAAACVALAALVASMSASCHDKSAAPAITPASVIAPTPGPAIAPATATAVPTPPVAPASTRSVWSGDAGAEAGADETIHLNRYTAGARQLIQSAQKLADERHHVMTTTLHLMARFLVLPPFQKMFRDANADPQKAKKLADDELARLPTTTKLAYLSAGALAVLQRAEQEAGTRDVSLTDVVNVAVSMPTADTLEDLDRGGLPPTELFAVKRIVDAARLDRILQRPQATATP